jgi:hypothetical protein
MRGRGKKILEVALSVALFLLLPVCGLRFFTSLFHFCFFFFFLHNDTSLTFYHGNVCRRLLRLLSVTLRTTFKK